MSNPVYLVYASHYYSLVVNRLVRMFKMCANASPVCIVAKDRFIWMASSIIQKQKPSSCLTGLDWDHQIMNLWLIKKLAYSNSSFKYFFFVITLLV